MKSNKIGVFRKIQQPRMMSVAELIAAQKWHDEHKDDLGHLCDFCPMNVVISAEEMKKIEENQ